MRLRRIASFVLLAALTAACTAEAKAQCAGLVAYEKESRRAYQKQQKAAAKAAKKQLKLTQKALAQQQKAAKKSAKAAKKQTWP